MKYYILLNIVILIICSCSTQSKNGESINKTNKYKEVELDFSKGEPTLIYKTKSIYYNKIPIQLSEDKKRIASYPHPKDVFYKGDLAFPSKLKDGYLLDNRGIGINTAFLNVTYEEYAKLESAPSISEMEKLILDNDPIVELYDCGNRTQFKDEIKELNLIIEGDQLFKCKRIK